VVPEEAGESQDAFFKVSILEEELRVMAPDLGAIQVGDRLRLGISQGQSMNACRASIQATVL